MTVASSNSRKASNAAIIPEPKAHPSPRGKNAKFEVVVSEPKFTHVLDVDGGEEAQLVWIQKNVVLPSSMTPVAYLTRRKAGQKGRVSLTEPADDHAPLEDNQSEMLNHVVPLARYRIQQKRRS